MYTLEKIKYTSQSRLFSLNFNEDEIVKIIRILKPHKVHGYDDISIGMIRICDKSLLKPLIVDKSRYFNNFFAEQCAPLKKSNILHNQDCSH